MTTGLLRSSLLSLLAACSGPELATDGTSPPTDGTPSETGADTGTDLPDSADTGTTPATDGLDPDGPTLRHVEFFQVVSVPVLWNGAEVGQRNAPLVADRAAVIRATLDVPAGWQTQDVVLTVAVDHDGLTDTYTQTVPLAAADTVAVDVPAEAIDGEATYTIEVARASIAQPSDRFPPKGQSRVDAEVTGPIKIHLVPYDVNGFVPDTSQAVLDGYRDAVFAVYPTTEVIITVGPVLTAPTDDLGDLLVDVGVQQEQVDLAPYDTYYYGMATGVATRKEFQGITGSSQEKDYRGGFAIGAAFGDQQAEDTLIHELGHLHYIRHADCGGAGADDPNFPYSNADIGVEGYDVRTGTYIAAGEAYDMMAYCYPRWVSDYHYDLLVDWVQHAQDW